LHVLGLTDSGGEGCAEDVGRAPEDEFTKQIIGFESVRGVEPFESPGEDWRRALKR
jgi:hypothetical protein